MSRLNLKCVRSTNSFHLQPGPADLILCMNVFLFVFVLVSSPWSTFWFCFSPLTRFLLVIKLFVHYSDVKPFHSVILFSSNYEYRLNSDHRDTNARRSTTWSNLSSCTTLKTQHLQWMYWVYWKGSMQWFTKC